MGRRLLALCLSCGLAFAPGYVAAQSALDDLESQLRGGRPLPEPGYAGVILDEDSNPGILVREVVPGGPAELAGLQAGDRIVMLDGQPVKTLADLIARLQTYAAGEDVECDLIRGETVLEAVIALGQRPPPGARRFAEFGPVGESAPREAALPAALGVRVEALDARTQQAAGVPVRRGVVVLDVAEGSPAAAAGLPVGAVVVAADGVRVGAPEELARVVAEADDGEVALSYYVQDQLHELTIALAAAEVAPGPPPAPRDEAPDLQSRVERLEQRLERIERLLERLLSAPPADR